MRALVVLLLRLILCLQYYFGDFNLMKDTFLQQEIQKGPDGCIFFAKLFRCSAVLYIIVYMVGVCILILRYLDRELC